MATRTLNGPDDIAAYEQNRIVFRSVTLPAGHPQAPLPSGGRVIEAQWGEVYDTATPPALVYGAEAVSFAEKADGSWDKATALRLS